jgi:TolB-like protein/class 3 adenylate cyclase
MERRLAAVMIADVAGYGRLSQADEEGTRARFQADLHDVFEPQIAAHHGRLVKTMGDGLLVEFHSVVDAVRCAIDVQRAKAERNAGVPDESRLEFRIGINLGDVIVEGDDIHGDGVNIADRLQSIADPGGVTVSGTAYDQVKTKLAVGYAHLGEQRVKNVAEPVRVYRVLMDAAAAGKTISGSKITARSWRWPAAAVAVVLAAGAAAWWRPWEPPIEPASVERMALPLPDKPSIAVLPFANMSDDPKQEYFVDGMTDGLITELSQVSGLFVISRNSTFVYKGKTVPPKQVSEELGVRYVLEGSVQRVGDQVRINAQLIDALSGGHEWAEKFDGSLADVFALQDKVTRSIADALAIRLTDAERHTLGQQETAVPAAYDAFLRGWEHFRRMTREDNARAVHYFEEAVRLDPDYGRAHAALALAYFKSYQRNWNDGLGISYTEAYERASRILTEAEKHPTSTARQVAGSMLLDSGAYDKAIAEFKEAIVLDPSDSLGYAYLALALSTAGQPAEAIPHIKTAMRVDPHYPSDFLRYLGLAQFGMDRFEDAAASLEAVTRLNPDDLVSLLLLGATYGHLGRKQDAMSAIAQHDARKVKEGGMPISIRRGPNFGFKNSADGLRVVRGLRLAGVPESLFSGDFARKNKLVPEEIRSLFFGHKIHGHAGGAGIDYAAAFASDGTADISGEWGLGTGLATQFKEDALCFEWPNGHTRCGTIYRNPGGTKAKENEYIWFDPFRAFTFSPVE